MGSYFSYSKIVRVTYFDEIPTELVEIIFSYLPEVDNLCELDIIHKIKWRTVHEYRFNENLSMTYDSYKHHLEIIKSYGLSSKIKGGENNICVGI